MDPAFCSNILEKLERLCFRKHLPETYIAVKKGVGDRKRLHGNIRMAVAGRKGRARRTNRSTDRPARSMHQYLRDEILCQCVRDH